MRGVVWVWVLIVCVGCSGNSRLLVVELRTDFAMGEDVATVRTTLVESAMQERHVADPALSYGAGVRVAEIDGLSAGTHLLQVELLAADGTVVAARPVLADLGRSLVVTVLITRACQGITCPPDLACIDGECVDPGCTPETPELCAFPPECSIERDCMPGVACATSECVTGICIDVTQDSSCGSTERCHPTRGCEPTEPRDAGPMDAGTDAGPTPPCGSGDAAIAVYDFDTMTLRDLVGGRDGLVIDGASMFGPSRDGCGSALLFPAGSPAWVQIPDDPAWDIAVGSVDLWFRYGPGAASFMGLLSRDEMGSGDGHFGVWLQDGRVVIRLQDSAGGESVLCASTAHTTDTWHHLGINIGPPTFEAFVDGAPLTFAGEILVNGFVMLPCGDSDPRAGLAGNDLAWAIGRNLGASPPAEPIVVESPFEGAIDHVRISRTRRMF